MLTLGMGFSPAKKYQCKFSSVSNTSIFTIFNASAAINSSTLNCGPCPTKPGSTSPFQSFFNVNFSLTIYEVNATNNATGMFVPSWGSSFVSYVPCNNGILDNTETGQWHHICHWRHKGQWRYRCHNWFVTDILCNYNIISSTYIH